jgi:hypothetical protein
MFYKQIKYFQFLLKSSNQHGVHSPFVYQLITQCLYKKKDKNLWKTFLNLKNNQLEILKKKNLKGNKNNILSHKKVGILLKIINYFQPENNLEISNSADLSVVSIAMNASNLKSTTVNESKELLSEIQSDKKFDCIYFHQNQITLYNFNVCLKAIHNNTFFIFNDPHNNQETRTTWSSIKKHSKVTVSVDVFYFGIVFFRKEQAKEHFKIRV